MPAKNSIKTYVNDGYYHIYNRGVEKRTIFVDDQDYKVFLSYLNFYLLDPSLRGESPKSFPSQQLRNYSNQIKLIAYCLMPNHFHLYIKQNNYNSMTFFMRSLLTRYSMYFNKRYRRVGSLFQGPYKAVYIANELQYLYLSKYIHRNPLDLPGYTTQNLIEYPYSSYPNFLGKIHQKWVHPEEIIGYFPQELQQKSYQQFVEENDELATEITTLANLTLDWET